MKTEEYNVKVGEIAFVRVQVSEGMDTEDIFTALDLIRRQIIER